MSKRFVHPHRRRAITVVFVLVSFPILFGFAALTIDVGLMQNTQVQLQNAADAAALAAAQDLGGFDPYDSIDQARATALRYILLNPVRDDQPIVVNAGEDILFGQSRLDDAGGGNVFTPNVLPANAVQVTVHHDVGLMFAWVFGMQSRRVSASATAGIGARDFMIVMDASGSMTKQSVDGEVCADLTALGIPCGGGGGGDDGGDDDSDD